MQKDEFHGHPRYLELTEEELELHSVKNKDYAHDGDSLGNFKRVSEVLKVWGYSVPPYLVALIYALKQQDAYMWMMSQGYEGQVEGVGTRLQDDYIHKKITRILYEDIKKADSVSIWEKAHTYEDHKSPSTAL